MEKLLNILAMIMLQFAILSFVLSVTSSEEEPEVNNKEAVTISKIQPAKNIK